MRRRRVTKLINGLNSSGDRVLGLVVAEMLYENFVAAEEGELSRRLADLVRRESCAEVAREWGVEAHVRLGEGERQAGPSAKEAILADVCESLIGAVFLDAGYAAAKPSLFRSSHRGCWRRAGRCAIQKPHCRNGRKPVVSKTPAYRETARTGPHHAPEFTVAVVVTGFAPADAKGSSKRTAEQAAAQAFLAREGIDNERG